MTFEQAVDVLVEGGGTSRQRAIRTLVTWEEDRSLSEAHAAPTLLGVGLDQQQVDEVLEYL